MRGGAIVRRKSETYRRVIDAGNPELQGEHWRDGNEHAPVIETGQEGCYLMHAWTDEERPVRIFCGASSKCPFVPDDEHRGATDWIIVEARDG